MKRGGCGAVLHALIELMEVECRRVVDRSYIYVNQNVMVVVLMRFIAFCGNLNCFLFIVPFCIYQFRVWLFLKSKIPNFSYKEEYKNGFY